MNKKVYFVYDFILPNGHLQFGYNKYTLPINVLHHIENNIEQPGVLLSPPNNPTDFQFQSGMFADEFISHNNEWNRIGVNEVGDILESNRYRENEYLFFIVLESTNTSNFFEYYLNQNLKFKDLFSPKLLDYIRENKNFKIIMMDNREGSYEHKSQLLDKADEFLKTHNIEGKRRFVISTCNEHINKFRQHPAVKGNQVYVYNNDFYIYKSGQFIVETEEQNNSIVENGYEYSLQQDLKFDEKEKYYLMYNRNSARLHRPYVVNKLYENNLLDKGIISLFKTEDFDNLLKSQNNNGNLGITIKDWQTWKKSINKWYPLVIDNDNEEEVAWYHNFLSRKDEYEKTYFSIVSETNAENNYLFVTEKTIKPIMNLHPFFINGNPGILKHLKSLGFQTFDKWWDESYDEELNFKKRADMLIEQVKLVCSKSKLEMIDMIKEMQPILQYNKSLVKQKFVSKKFEKNLVNVFNTTMI